MSSFPRNIAGSDNKDRIPSPPTISRPEDKGKTTEDKTSEVSLDRFLDSSTRENSLSSLNGREVSTRAPVNEEKEYEKADVSSAPSDNGSLEGNKRKTTEDKTSDVFQDPIPASSNEDLFQQTLKKHRTPQSEIETNNKTPADKSSATLLNICKTFTESEELDEAFETIKQITQLPNSEGKTQALKEIIEALCTLISDKGIIEKAPTRSSLDITLKVAEIAQKTLLLEQKSSFAKPLEKLKIQNKLNAKIFEAFRIRAIQKLAHINEAAAQRASNTAQTGSRLEALQKVFEIFLEIKKPDEAFEIAEIIVKTLAHNLKKFSALGSLTRNFIKFKEFDKASKVAEMLPCKYEQSQTLQDIVTTLIQQAGSNFNLASFLTTRDIAKKIPVEKQKFQALKESAIALMQNASNDFGITNFALEFFHKYSIAEKSIKNTIFDRTIRQEALDSIKTMLDRVLSSLDLSKNQKTNNWSGF